MHSQAGQKTSRPEELLSLQITGLKEKGFDLEKQTHSEASAPQSSPHRSPLPSRLWTKGGQAHLLRISDPSLGVPQHGSFKSKIMNQDCGEADVEIS